MTNQKHAYLIIAHANPYVLEKLILLLDDERNDIYIHVDCKSDAIDFPFFQQLVKHSKLIFIERINIHWGHVSQIEVELKLFRVASQKEKYAYYHLISGSDLPIKKQDDIHRFFALHAGVEFVGFSSSVLDLAKVNKIHLFPKYQRVLETQWEQRMARKLRMWFLGLQHRGGDEYGANVKEQYKQGSNWVSITHALVDNLLKKEKWFLDFYRHSSCADEIYKHTYIFNSKYIDSVYDVGNELKSCQRFMDWQRGRPYTFRSEDLDLIMSSDMLFARKFEDEVDKVIVDAIYNALRSK